MMTEGKLGLEQDPRLSMLSREDDPATDWRSDILSPTLLFLFFSIHSSWRLARMPEEIKVFNKYVARTQGGKE